MTQLARLVWREGMYLGPHHFQLQQRYFEDAGRFAIEQLFFKPYGLASCVFDAETLRNGFISLVRARGLLPDGTPFSIPDSDEAPEPLAVRSLGPASHENVILLVLPTLRRDAPNVSSAAENGSTVRLRVIERTIRDETTGREDRTVEFGAKNFRLTTRDGLRAEEVALPVARLTRADGAGLSFDPAFVPPVLSISASDTLMRLVERLVETLEAKTAALANDQGGGPSGMPNYAVTEVAAFWLRHTIHSSLAPMRHMLVAGHVHPEQLYLACARLAGALCTFATDADPRMLPPYDHDDPGPGFATLERLIRERLDWSKPTDFIRLPLEAATLEYTSRSTGKTIGVDGFRSMVADDRAFGDAQWILGVRAPISTAELIAKVPALVKVCSAGGVAFLVAHAHPGFELTHLPFPPATIAPRSDTQYFAIQRAGGCDTLLTASREIGVYVPHSIPNPSLDLLVALAS